MPPGRLQAQSGRVPAAFGVASGGSGLERRQQPELLDPARRTRIRAGASIAQVEIAGGVQREPGRPFDVVPVSTHPEGAEQARVDAEHHDPWRRSAARTLVDEDPALVVDRDEAGLLGELEFRVRTERPNE